MYDALAYPMTGRLEKKSAISVNVMLPKDVRGGKGGSGGVGVVPGCGYLENTASRASNLSPSGPKPCSPPCKQVETRNKWQKIYMATSDMGES